MVGGSPNDDGRGIKGGGNTVGWVMIGCTGANG